MFLKKNKIKIISLIIIIFTFLFFKTTFSQSNGGNNSQNNDSNNSDTTNSNYKIKELPRSYKDFFLGMSKKNFLEIINKITYLDFEGEIEIPFNNFEKDIYKASSLPVFIKILFYFYKDILVQFNFYYNSKKITPFNNLQRLISKLGKPMVIDMNRFKWEDDKTLIIFEKTNILKVIDKGYLKEINKEFESYNQLKTNSINEQFDNF